MNHARLQFRWEMTEKPADQYGCRDWLCKYELSIPLNDHDIRREDENYSKVRDCQIIELGVTRRGSSQEPCIADGGGYYFDVPYRDGAHAGWDADKLGNLPIVCIALDGTVIPKPIKSSDQPPQTHVSGHIVCDVWGGDLSQDHLARYMLPLKDALQWAAVELAQGYLINLRHDADFGPTETFDRRSAATEGSTE